MDNWIEWQVSGSFSPVQLRKSDKWNATLAFRVSNVVGQFVHFYFESSYEEFLYSMIFSIILLGKNEKEEFDLI